MADEALTQPNRPTLNPSALPVADAARLLTAAGGLLVTAEMIQADVDAGAPVNADGTMNLVHYTAWLVMQMAARDTRSPEADEGATPFALREVAEGGAVTSDREEEKIGVGH